MFDAMLNGRIDTEGLNFEVDYLDIEQLNEAALDVKYDVSKCSTALLPAIIEEYSLLDSGSALGRGNGPLLVRRRGETTPIRRIAVPGEHTTANRLVMRLFADIEERHPLLFSEIAEAVERGDYHKRNLVLVADLGLEWERVTALPLPLGSIVARRDLEVGVVEAVERVLRRSIEYAFAHPMASRDYVKSHAQELDDAVIESHIALFVNDYSLALGTEGRRAIAELTGLTL